MFIRLTNYSNIMKNTVRVNVDHIVYYYSVMNNPETSYSTWIHMSGGQQNLAVMETVEEIDAMIQAAIENTAVMPAYMEVKHGYRSKNDS